MSKTSQVDALCAAAAALRVDRSSGVPTRHQPITLLWAIGRAAANQPRMVRWTKARAELKPLLEEFGRTGADPSPEYPFVALSRSGLWELRGYEGEVPAAHGSGLQRWLDDHEPLGGLEHDFYELMATAPTARKRVVDTLMSQFFDTEKSADLLKNVRLGIPDFDGYGAVPGIEVGRVFANRQALHDVAVHRPLQAGICGTADGGAESIVLSGGYEDDEDHDDVIIYTGQGGRDNNTGRQVRDQTLTRGNAALVTSQTTGIPVRVVKGDTDTGYRYDGLFRVEAFWHAAGQSEFLVWRYRLARISSDETVTQDPAGMAPEGRKSTTRVETTFQRIIRSTKVANYVKRVHGFTCQVCGTRLATPTGAYAEAAHIRALGKPHNGPDLAGNILCLCPNHHTLFDFGMLSIADDLTITDRATGARLGRLREVRGHRIDQGHLAYHREHHSERWKHGQDDGAGDEGAGDVGE